MTWRDTKRGDLRSVKVNREKKDENGDRLQQLR